MGRSDRTPSLRERVIEVILSLSTSKIYFPPTTRLLPIPTLYHMKRIPLFLLACTPLLVTMCQNFNEEALPITANNYNQEAASQLLEEARALMSRGKYAAARTKLKRLVRVYRISKAADEARLLYATCYERENDPREAFKQYDKLIHDYPSSPLYMEAIRRQTELARGAAQGTVKGEVFWGAWIVEMDTSVVVEWLQSVIKNAPFRESAAESSLILGNYFIKKKMLTEALATLHGLVEQYPSSRFAPNAQMMVGDLWASSASRGDRNLVNLNKAQEAYDEFVLLYPNHKDTKKARGLSHKMQQLMVHEQLNVARFYLERSRQYQSAVFTLEDVIRQAHINPAAAAEARKLLPLAKARLAGGTQ